MKMAIGSASKNILRADGAYFSRSPGERALKLPGVAKWFADHPREDEDEGFRKVISKLLAENDSRPVVLDRARSRLSYLRLVVDNTGRRRYGT
jgi:hypothetical protein